MRYLIITISVLFFSSVNLACEHLVESANDNSSKLMGKKSKFYDAYKQGKCVLEEALKPFSEEQRELIANLIAKTYKIDN